MYCSKCGTYNDDNTYRCMNCGTVIQQAESSGDPSLQNVSSHLAPAILVTIFCCLPLGIVAIVYAAQASGRLKDGDLNGAVAASKKAKTWCWVAFGLGLAFQLLSILAAIAIPNFVAYREKAFDAAARQELRKAATAQEAYYEDNSTYADSIEKLLDADYGLSPSEKVTVEVISAGADHYEMVAFHEEGKKKFHLTGPDGVIKKYPQ